MFLCHESGLLQDQAYDQVEQAQGENHSQDGLKVRVDMWSRIGELRVMITRGWVVLEVEAENGSEGLCRRFRGIGGETVSGTGLKMRTAA